MLLVLSETILTSFKFPAHYLSVSDKSRRLNKIWPCDTASCNFISISSGNSFVICDATNHNWKQCLLIIPPLQRSWKGGGGGGGGEREAYTGFTLSSVCPSMDRIISALYLQQYLPDPFHIYTFFQPTSGVSYIKLFFSKLKIVQFWQIF